jgi:tryptophan synthase alpha chain
VRGFRTRDRDTPIVLMGYLNPIESYGADAFARDAAEAGVDGLIVVDLPAEEAEALVPQAQAAGIDVIRLATPTSDDARLPRVLEGASGFLYYVLRARHHGDARRRRSRDRAGGDAAAPPHRPTIAVGFGIKTPEAAAAVARVADGAVVGTSIVQAIAASLDPAAKATPRTVEAALGLVRRLADAVRGARQKVPA